LTDLIDTPDAGTFPPADASDTRPGDNGIVDNRAGDQPGPPDAPFVLGGRLHWSWRGGLAVLLVVAFVALPVRGLYRATGSSMEEGFMLVFPHLVWQGRIPNVDFLHLYGPGSLDILALWYQLFGYTLEAERTFGLLQQAKLFSSPRILFCPAEKNVKFDFDTPENPWPGERITPNKNVQAGYGARPEREIPDDLAAAANGGSFSLPRLTNFKNKAIFADLTAARNRVLARHRIGINVLYGNGSARWVSLRAFDQAEPQWPEPQFPPTPAFNPTQDVIWAKLDRQ